MNFFILNLILPKFNFLNLKELSKPPLYSITLILYKQEYSLRWNRLSLPSRPLFSYPSVSILSSLSFTCQFCLSQVPLTLLNQHYSKTWPHFVYKHCSSSACSFESLSSDLPAHEAECPLVEVKWKRWYNPVIRKDIISGNHSCLELTKTIYSSFMYLFVDIFKICCFRFFNTEFSISLKLIWIDCMRNVRRRLM